MLAKNNVPFLRNLLKCLAFILAINFAFECIAWGEEAKKIPAVVKGNVVVFSAEMYKRSRISDFDATDQYIYFAYSDSGVVAVYDWNGNYQYSLSFYDDTNGTLGIRCEDGLLYVHDFAEYEFIFSGDTLISTYPPSEKPHYTGWFDDNTSVPILIRNNAVYDKAGNFIMQLPGKTWWDMLEIKTT